MEKCDSCTEHSGIVARFEHLDKDLERLNNNDVKFVESITEISKQITSVDESTKSAHKRSNELEVQIKTFNESVKAIYQMSENLKNLAERIEESNTLLKEQDKKNGVLLREQENRYTNLMSDQEKRYLTLLDKIETRMEEKDSDKARKIETLQEEVEILKDMPGKLSLKLNIFMASTLVVALVTFLFDKFGSK